MNQFVALLFSFSALFALSQDQLEVIDVLNYDINLEVFEEYDTIIVDEQIRVKLLKEVDSFYFDLHSLDAGSGMVVSKVEVAMWDSPKQSVTVPYSHVNNRLWISTKEISEGAEFLVEVWFSGIPETGLIISENEFGKRTYFGDNWPNRAHHWFACVDHPSDKATVAFTVTYPRNQRLIANGFKLNRMGEKGDKNIGYYRCSAPIPTKVMVVGIAEFDTQFINHAAGDFTMTAWVYKESREFGFKDLAVARDVINFFVKAIGPYPFSKLDHVQSTTQFGGMENAGNIFYDENAFTGEERMEALIAHEVAHQWFGNSASESDWQHLWLSEGFATYFTDLYWEDKYGTEAMNERLISERNRVIRFSNEYDHPIIDTTYESLMSLLNSNAYQKGAWFLHMLRNEVGDAVFWSGIRNYYKTYKYSNATSADFQAVMESESKMDLSVFFHQWLKESQHPTLKIKEKTEKRKIIIRQKQKSKLFVFDLEIELNYADGSSEIKVLPFSRKKGTFKLETDKEITGLKYDPNVKLLFEVVQN